MPNYKWFRCCGIADAEVETRNVKVETGRAVRVKPRTLCKTNPQRARHPGASQRLRALHPLRFKRQTWGTLRIVLICEYAGASPFGRVEFEGFGAPRINL